MSSIVLSIFLLSMGASFIQRTTGFGFGIFIMTMLPFLMPSYGEATTLSGLLAITTSAAIVWRLRDYVTWQRLWLYVDKKVTFRLAIHYFSGGEKLLFMGRKVAFYPFAPYQRNG